ncbi:uncharacterized protein PGTG_21489 [Puccinia graminis f. sp. tritici CRL 75-36-700-3]|uniref:GCM domain-containing protein n=1 Tax=Puccinia graminis f. sp. tritici (strain CRL 75-36-700-3 / race SCCL) TaxID=418459 RepID=H6QRK1_PUCGT|nr:uncharacterized protein PGTG_21489 [Puccinia graminis f. sp. tritici CRL 75-36-700-3]EHS63272.1 hypothetical protein PGTG_21489 [Puccinia graminis f. sp. tritici CRL 75-36-700-3]
MDQPDLNKPIQEDDEVSDDGSSTGEQAGLELFEGSDDETPANVPEKRQKHSARPIKDKEWFLPDIQGDHQTFIDHGCSLDKQGYPLYPNGKTIFVSKPEDKITNFGQVGFVKTSSVNRPRPNRPWKVTRYFCLGVLVCDNPSCEWAGPPPTAKGRVEEYINSNPTCPGLAGNCNGVVEHQKCTGTAVQFDLHSSGWGLLRHKGVHPHPWPAPKKPDPLSQDEFKAQVAKNPKAGAFKLKLGKTTHTNTALESVTTIHPAYQNKDRTAYYRRKYLVEMDLTPDKLGGGIGDKFILHMFHWSAQGLLIILSSFLPKAEHFTFQTKWMADRLVAQDKNGQLYNGGLLSDVTYWFFENGYLLTTSMFCDDLQRWIPVQLTWIRGLSDKYYKIHFTVLFQQLFKHTMTMIEREGLASQVVDFSAAQANGFIQAYCEVFREPDASVARNLLKGCREHYRQSITRVKRNWAVITADEEEPFRKACMDLLTPPAANEPTHEEKVDSIHRRYPKVKKWLDWWTTADVEAMLFRTRKPLLEDTPDARPETTNGQESMHRLYYMIR